ncbi:MAG: glycogen debranching protein [Actinomycetia bacterium]|nr:glycogen debranching protein [Actinomycetes bacterium]
MLRSSDADHPRPVPRETTSVLWGSTFALSDEAGDILPGTVWGVFHRDMRVLSAFALEIDGQRPISLSSGKPAPHAARFYTTLGEQPGRGISIERRRVVGDDLLEDITLQSHRSENARLLLRLRLAADFADLFEVKAGTDPPSSSEIDPEIDGTSIRFRSPRTDREISTLVSFSRPPQLDEGVATYAIDLPARGTWHLRVRVGWDDGFPIAARLTAAQGDGRAAALEEERGAARDFERWISAFPVLRTGSDMLRRMYRRSVEDLGALRLTMRVRERTLEVPAAGLPWFMTIFGRDSLITAYEVLPFAPGLASGTLEALAAVQGEQVDHFRDEEPGKILHEIRNGPLTVSGVLPYDPYYGSVDATPLWLIVLSEYERWTGDTSLVRDLWGNAVQALDWIDERLAASPTGYLDYRTRSNLGLVHQGWKDSGDGIRFSNGSVAEPPIALVEVQGYVFDAWIRTADLAGRVIGDLEFERELRGKARRLEQRFQQDYWLEDRGGFYALGLDPAGRPIDAMTSNMGHLLWSGLVPPEREAAIIDNLFSSSMWSGWGVRTMSSDDAGYDPIGYHVGSVWPHDNALIAEGLARAGRWDRSGQIARAMIQAAGHQESRLPEVFAGYDRDDTLFPVRYPSASSPQAWATASTFVWIKSMLGMEAGNILRVTPNTREEDWVELDGLRFRGQRYDVRRGLGVVPSNG